MQLVSPSNNGGQPSVPANLLCPPSQTKEAPGITPNVLYAFTLQKSQAPIQRLIREIEPRHIVASQQGVFQPLFQIPLRRHPDLHVGFSDAPACPLEREQERRPIPGRRFAVFPDPEVPAR